jgi:hypothetical protein
VNVTVIVLGWHVEDEGIDGGLVTTQEQADEILWAFSKHSEISLGYAIFCAITAVVYVAQNWVASGHCSIWDRQLSG